MFYWEIWPRISFNYCQIFAAFYERDGLHFENHKKMWRKMKKIIIEFVFNSLLIWNFQNSEFEFKISPNRPFYSVDRVLTEIDVLFSSIEQKSLCAEIWWNPHEIPVRPRKKLKLAVAHTPKFFDWVFFLSWMSFVLSSLFACVGEKLVEKKKEKMGEKKGKKKTIGRWATAW